MCTWLVDPVVDTGQSICPNMSSTSVWDTDKYADWQVIPNLWSEVALAVDNQSAWFLNPFKPEFTIVIFIHYKPRIAVAILDLQRMKMIWLVIENCHV